MQKNTPPKHIILYADDDADDLQFVTEAFSRHLKNIDVVTAVDGAEALDYLQNIEIFGTLPCLIILDVNMPRLNGKEALARIRKAERFKDVPVVLFTTSSSSLDQDFAKLYNAYFRTKPTHQSEIGKIADEFVAYCNEETKKHIRKAV